MKLVVKREACENSWTNGKLYIDGVAFCDTIEDRNRHLSDDMPLEEIKSIKVYGETAIPSGTYKVSLDIVSPKFSQYDFYKEVCGGKLPRLLDVKGFEGILIHVADGYKKDKLLQGCIGIGVRQADGSLLHGKETFKKLYDIIKGEKDLTIDIS